MERDYARYPDDENGDVLWKMLQGGDNLDIPREVDFAVIFPDEQAAMDFAMRLLRYGQKVSFGRYEGVAGFPWQVQAHPIMVPSHEHVSGYERQLGKDAAALGGRNDGWGCYGRE
jgi:hypothetical protein